MDYVPSRHLLNVGHPDFERIAARIRGAKTDEEFEVARAALAGLIRHQAAPARDATRDEWCASVFPKGGNAFGPLRGAPVFKHRRNNKTTPN